MRQRRTLYRRVAGVEPNDGQVTDSKSVERLWRNLPPSSGIASIPSQPSEDPPPPRVDSDFMSIDTPETYLTPACS